MSKRKYPTPVYAAAGAGEAIVEELKKIPSRVDELRGRTKFDERAQEVTDAVRSNVRQGVSTLRSLDGQKVREAATETASTLGEQTRKAREKAKTTYEELVERGENVANGERSPIKVIATIAHAGDDKDDKTQKTTNSAPKTKKTSTTTKSSTTKKPAAKKPAKAAAAD